MMAEQATANKKAAQPITSSLPNPLLTLLFTVSQAAKKKALEMLAKRLKEMISEQEKADKKAARAATAAGATHAPFR